MAQTEGYRLAQPPHVGSFIKEEIVTPRDLTITEAAKVLKVTRAALSKLLNAHASLSPEMALRIEKAFGVKMDTLMRMQSSYDIAQARQMADTIDVLPFRGDIDDARATERL